MRRWTRWPGKGRGAWAREGARRMIVAALEAEVAAYVERYRAVRGENGRAAVVRNGRGRPGECLGTLTERDHTHGVGMVRGAAGMEEALAGRP